MKKNQFCSAGESISEPAMDTTHDKHHLPYTLQRFFKNKTAVIFLCIFLLLLIFTILQPLLPGQHNPVKIHNDPLTGLPYRNHQPDAQFWFGTNSIGQDLWARVWAGTRTSLKIGFSVALINCLLGTAVGLVWGYHRHLDTTITEAYTMVDSIPQMLILILLSYILRPGIKTIIAALCLTGWLPMARHIRNVVLSLREREFIIASKAIGSSSLRIMTKHLLPNLAGIIVLRTALAVPAAIGCEVFVTYIGIGLPADVPSLGTLIHAGRGLVMEPSLSYQLLFPVAVLILITLSLYVIGNAFADAADPQNR